MEEATRAKPAAAPLDGSAGSADTEDDGGDSSSSSNAANANANASVADVRPAWESDCSKVACSECSTPFSVLNRRHHCRGCGKLFCDGCSNSRIRLPPEFKYSSAQRVCDNCYLVFYAKLKLRLSTDGNVVEASPVRKK